MLTEASRISQINVLEHGHIQVQRADCVFKDGVEISKAYHRHVIHPGQDYSGEDGTVQAICRIIHTPKAVAAYELAKGITHD
jgi:hypothetical protein